MFPISFNEIWFVFFSYNKILGGYLSFIAEWVSFVLLFSLFLTLDNEKVYRTYSANLHIKIMRIVLK
jgi:hypothetical protein